MKQIIKYLRQSKQWVLFVVRKRKSKKICRNCKRYSKTGKCFAVWHNDICGIKLNPKTKACFKFENKHGNNYVA